MPPRRLSEEEIERELATLSGWSRRDQAIEKTFKLGGFPEAIAFVQRVAEVAEEMDHHPDIFIRFHRVTFTLTTHGARGLTELDFELARRIDALATA